MNDESAPNNRKNNKYSNHEQLLVLGKNNNKQTDNGFYSVNNIEIKSINNHKKKNKNDSDIII